MNKDLKKKAELAESLSVVEDKKLTLKRLEEKKELQDVRTAQELANETLILGGEARAHVLYAQMGRAGFFVTMKKIKESEAYKNISECGGTWAGYCELLGFNASTVDKNLKSIEVFGEAYYRALLNHGLGYRDLATIKALPMGARAEIFEGDGERLKKMTKVEIREWVDELKARHQSEKSSLKTNLKAAEKKLSKAEAKAENQAKQIGQLEKDLKEAKTGLGENEEQALKTLSGLHNSITGVAAMLQATDTELKVQIRSQAMGFLAYMETLARLTMIELGYELGDGTTWGEVEAARADFEKFYGDGDPDLH